MNNNTNDEFIAFLEAHWSFGGFLGDLREGNFEVNRAMQFSQELRARNIHGDCIPKRLASLIWFMPLFVKWQRERVVENGGNLEIFIKFENEISNIVMDLLGVP